MFLMKKNHLDFKDLAQSLAMDKVKLERYVTVSFLLVLQQQVSFITALLFLGTQEIGPDPKRSFPPVSVVL